MTEIFCGLKALVAVNKKEGIVIKIKTKFSRLKQGKIGSMTIADEALVWFESTESMISIKIGFNGSHDYTIKVTV